MQVQAPISADCRREARHHTEKLGRIVTSWQRYGLQAQVLNMSSDGAQLEVSHAAKLPPTFNLWIDADGLVYPCRICWRRRDLIGVTFTRSPYRATTTTMLDED